MIHPILVIALMCITVILLLRITMQTPVVSGLFEKFTSGSLLNSTTECPAGYSMYMYEGGAYCCKGRVNTDSHTLERSCVAATTEKNTLCSLGPSTGVVPNCAKIRKTVLQKQGELVCPPSMPNFCTGDHTTPKGRCCTSVVNEQGTNCVRQEGSCSVGPYGPDAALNNELLTSEFITPNDCRFLKLKESDSKCPSGYYSTVSNISNPTNPLNGLTLYGCTNLSDICYTPKLIQRLSTIGYDVRQLVQC